MELTPIRLPVGVRDFLPRAAARRRAIAEGLLGELERWGYERIITPAFEYLDVLARGLGADARAAALRFVEPATGEVVALRPDITPQVARLAATRFTDVDGPLRLCYEGEVLRLSAGARGQRELVQAGVELIGAAAPAGDAEVMALAAAASAAVVDLPLTLDVGHVALVHAALAGLPDERRGELRALVARKDSGGVAHAVRRLGPPRPLLEALPSLYGDPQTVLARARALPLDETCRAALEQVTQVLDLLGGLGVTARITLDLGEVRGFEYYTGLRFAGYVEGSGDAVVRGGRYDDLVGRYGREARATGFAFDVDLVAQADAARGHTLPPSTLVLVSGGERALSVARSLRAAGLRAAVDLRASSPSGDAGTLSYARAAGAFLALVVDGDPRTISPSGSTALGAELLDRGPELAAELRSRR
jgi:ATP phosphoribosyltransferase regulatory subunit